MNDKERFDGYVRLAELRTQRATNRQTYEWRVTFGIWAVLTAATIYLKDRPLPLWFGAAVILVYGFFWLRAIYVAHWMDNGAAAVYVREALCILEPGQARDESQPEPQLSRMGWLFGFLTEWGCIFQLLGTLLLIYFFYLMNNPNALPVLLRGG